MYFMCMGLLLTRMYVQQVCAYMNLEAYITTSGVFDAGDGTQGFMQAQESHIPTSFSFPDSIFFYSPGSLDILILSL